MCLELWHLWFFLYTSFFYHAHRREFSGNFTCSTVVRQITSITHSSEDDLFLFRALCVHVRVNG